MDKKTSVFHSCDSTFKRSEETKSELNNTIEEPTPPKLGTTVVQKLNRSYPMRGGNGASVPFCVPFGQAKGTRKTFLSRRMP
ncbi:MAG: hypothetical protein KF880_09295 [Ferruginibacter sp.]|nr:hypothetical protein [Ferruginibacter sp.]